MAVNDEIIKILEDALATLPTKGSLILRCSPRKKQKQSLVTKQSRHVARGGSIEPLLSLE